MRPNLLALLLSTAILGIGSAAAAARAGEGQIVAAVAISVYLLWICFETATVTRRESRRPVSPADRGTLELYTLARGAAAILILALDRDALAPYALAGLSMLFAGILLRALAIDTLGRHYSHQVRVEAEHAVVSTGVYRLIRHPAYAGMLLAHAGWLVVFSSAAGALALLCTLVPAILARIQVEERVLYQMADYEQYARCRARLIPGVW